MIPPLLAIFSFPVVVVILFRLLERPAALIWSILLGYLFLPTRTNWDLPLLPAIDKNTMPVLAAICCLLVMAFGSGGRGGTRGETPLPGLLPRHPVVLLLLAGLVVGAFLTVLTNGDALVYGPLRLPALRTYDGFAAILSTVMGIVPLLLARKYLASEASQRLLMQSMCIAACIYSLPIIFELMMSPQLNRIVYGFFPHSWKQHLRDGGYRPLVFLEHGLWLGIFMCVTVLAATGYARLTPPPRKMLYYGLAAWLMLILVSVKSLGAFAIALVLVPAILFLGARMQLLLAALVAGSVLLYPALRGTGLIPVEQAVNLAASIDPVRARSLEYRLLNEDMLLAKANQRPTFGWGGWGRARIFDEDGQDISTTDGYWVIVIGERGWLGYLSRLGLLCIPILLLAFRRRDRGGGPSTAILSLVLAGNLIDLIPNAGLTPVTWMIAGALAGRLELRRAETPTESTADAPDTRSTGIRFTRFGAGTPRAAAMTPPASGSLRRTAPHRARSGARPDR